MSKLSIEDERDNDHRYAAYVDGKRVGSLSALLVHRTVLLPHIEVDAACHDLGIGSILVRRALDDARAEGLSALALSPFVRRWVDLHPSYGDVVRRPVAGELAAVSSLIAADRTMRLLHGDGTVL